MNLRIHGIELLTCGLLLSAPASIAAQTWIEKGDARSFPDRTAQRTLEEGAIAAIAGATDFAAGDPRDAFCVRIGDPAYFLATTDPYLAPAAGADFDVRLFLFTGEGRPLLASGGPSPRRQTLAPALEPAAGSRAAFGPPGEYILVVAGAGAAPGDSSSRHLFAAPPSAAGQRPPDRDAGAFHHWREEGTASGTYVVGLEGGEGCGDLDIVLAIDDNNKLDRYCLGVFGTADDFHCHGVSGDEIAAMDVELGDFDADGNLDAVFATSAAFYANRICPGDDVGRFSFSGCSAFGPTDTRGRALAVGHLDDDTNLDVVVTNQQEDAIACLGDGALGFACTDVGAGAGQGRGVALGHLNADGNLDAVFGYQDPPHRVCLGDGTGAFTCSDLSDVDSARDVALGDFDNDENLDIVLTGQFSDRICLGDGTGSFAPCSAIHGDLSSGTSVAVGFLDADTNLDLAFARAPITSGRTCLGDGLGGFTCSTFGDPGFTPGMTEIALADFDDNGDLDAAISFDLYDDWLCFGDGLGSFGNCVPFAAHNYEAQGLAVGPLAPASVGWDDFETGDLRAWATPDL
ncbi:MAG: VCBS repeat-containing protein [Myxococcales bacterium]|nr:VCBS repeat-containing protein [Myxococcales bacterium]